MRRFSQRSALVTLNEINITPLLDLAFVLLIIFVITTPLLEQSVSLTLPEGGGPSPALKKEEKRLVEISRNGEIRLNGKVMTIPQVEAELVKASRDYPNLVVGIRCDKLAAFDFAAQIVDRCERHGITRIAISTQAPRGGRQ